MNHYGVTHIKGVEDQSIYVLPNVPSNSGDDGIVFIGAAAKRPKFFKAHGEGVEVREGHIQTSWSLEHPRRRWLVSSSWSQEGQVAGVASECRKLLSLVGRR
jgi:hypothetical protein